MKTKKGYFVIKGQNLVEHTQNTNEDANGPYQSFKSAFDKALDLKSMWLNRESYYTTNNGFIYDRITGKQWDSYCK